jgi:hypothetical protein
LGFDDFGIDLCLAGHYSGLHISRLQTPISLRRRLVKGSQLTAAQWGDIEVILAVIVTRLSND